MFLEINDLHHIYMPGTPFEVKALKGVSFSVHHGEFVGIMGGTGSGKSTLLQHLNGLLEPTRGTVCVNGEYLGEKSKKPKNRSTRSLKELRTRIGMVFQYPEHQLFAENIYQEVAYGPINQGLSIEEVEIRVKQALSQVALDYEELKERSPFQLSGGQMRRVALAGVLSMEPEALILDEPTSGLDPQGRRELLKYVEALHRDKGLTVIMVTHHPQELLNRADRILVVHCGEIQLSGTPREVFSCPEKLKQLDVEMPAPVQLAEELRQKGYPLRRGLITEDEVCEEIVRVVPSLHEGRG